VSLSRVLGSFFVVSASLLVLACDPVPAPISSGLAVGVARSCVIAAPPQVVDAGVGSDAGSGSGATLTTGGPLYCWGDGDLRAVPTQLSISDAVQVSLGEPNCVLRLRGSVSCWGENSAGEVGDGTTEARPDARAVPGLVDAVQVATSRFRSTGSAFGGTRAGPGFACAVRARGVVSCWGANDAGQLGDGSTTERHLPTIVTGIEPALAVALGARHACALVAGEVFCWGANDRGQLGNSNLADSPRPVRVQGVEQATAIALGEAHSCALLATGEVMCWGRNDLAQLGQGSVGADGSVPRLVLGLSGATRIAAGANHSCVATAEGVLCWGADDQDQTGVPGNGPQVQPGISRQLAPVSELSAGAAHTCVVTAGEFRQVFCWGANDLGQLGGGDTQPSSFPRSVYSVP